MGKKLTMSKYLLQKKIPPLFGRLVMWQDRCRDKASLSRLELHRRGCKVVVNK
jgi:hypothetical protein